MLSWKVETRPWEVEAKTAARAPEEASLRPSQEAKVRVLEDTIKIDARKALLMPLREVAITALRGGLEVKATVLVEA